MRGRAFVVGWVVAGVSIAAGEPNESQRQEAQEAFERARALYDEGKTTEACALFARSFDLDAKPGTELNVARCKENAGSFADAARLYDDVLSTSKRDGNAARAEVAQARLAELIPKLATVVIEIGAGLPAGTSLSIGRQQVPPAARVVRWVDPGPLDVRVVRPGATPFDAHRAVRAGETVTLEVPAPAPAQTAEEPTTTGRSRGRVILSAALGGLGAAALVGGGVLAWQSHSAYESQLSNGNCAEMGGRPLCNSAGVAAIDDANARADVATGFAVAGFALVAAGAIVWFTSPSSAVITPVATHDSAGMSVALTF